MNKVYVKVSTRRNKDGDELVTVDISPSAMKKVSYIVFVEKSVKKSTLNHKSSYQQ